MAIDQFTPGFRLTDGDHLNQLVDAVNSSVPAGGLANGTAGAPSMAFASDTDTGIYRPAANKVGVSAGGSLVGTFDANGFNGVIGGTTPAAATVTALTASGNAELTGAVVSLGSVVTGITAHAGGGQGSATALTGAINSVDTVGTAADSVKLPAPTHVGQRVTVINTTATSMQVFGSGTDTINAVATATGVAQAAGKSADYIAITTGTAAAWFRILSA